MAWVQGPIFLEFFFRARRMLVLAMLVLVRAPTERVPRCGVST